MTGEFVGKPHSAVSVRASESCVLIARLPTDGLFSLPSHLFFFFDFWKVDDFFFSVLFCEV